MKFGYFIVLYFISFVSLATHNRAGEISFKQIGVNQYEITLITYTRIETDADRPVIDINWGDGSIDSLKRSEGFPEFIAFDINKNEKTYLLLLAIVIRRGRGGRRRRRRIPNLPELHRRRHRQRRDHRRRLLQALLRREAHAPPQ